MATPTRYGNAGAIAVGPDGTAYLAFGRCRLGRLAPGKALAFGAAPIPVRDLAFDPSGGLWLASAARLVHAPTTNLSRGTCDDTPPTIKLSPALRGPVRLSQLRRGVRITVREPATISASADYGNDDHDSRLRIVRAKAGGTLTFRLPREQIGSTSAYSPPAANRSSASTCRPTTVTATRPWPSRRRCRSRARP